MDPCAPYDIVDFRDSLVRYVMFYVVSNFAEKCGDI